MRWQKEELYSRKYRGEEVDGETLMRILWAGIGKNRRFGGRTAPMPMSDIIIKLYVASKDGVSLYDGANDTLKMALKNDIRD